MEADGSVVINVDVDDKKAQAELNRLQRQIDSIKRSMEKKTRRKSLLTGEAEALEAQIEAQRIKTGKIDLGLEKELNAKNAAISKIDEQLKYQAADLKAAEEEAGKYAARLSQVGTAGNEAGKRIAAFGKRILGLAKRVFVFSLITKALRNVRKWIGSLIGENNEAAQAVARLKGALLTLAQPILNSVIPALTKLINWLTKVISAIAAVVSALFGTTAEASAAAAEALYNEQNAIEGVGGSADKAKKQLAGFDEINKLAGEDAGGGGASGNAMSPLFDAITIPNWLDEFLSNFKITVSDVLFDWDDVTGEQIAEKAIAGLSALAGGVIGFAIGGVPGALIGTLAGLVLGLIIDTITFDHDGKLNKAEITRLLYTSVLALLGGVVGFAVGGIVGAAVGITIGLVLSLVFTSINVEYQKQLEEKAMSTPLGQLINASLNNSRAALQAEADLRVNIDSITGEIPPEKLADLNMAKQLVSEIFELDAEDNKTAGQLALIKTKIDELNALGLEGVSLSFDDFTQSVVGSKDAILETIDALLQQYQVEALHDAYVEQYKNQFIAYQDLIQYTRDLEEANRLYEEALNGVTTAQENLNAAQEEHYSRDTFDPDFYSLDEWREPIEDETEALRIATIQLEKAKEARDNLAAALQATMADYEDAKNRVDDLGKAYEDLIVSMSDSSDDAVDSGNAMMEGVEKGINEGLPSVEQAMEDARKAIQKAGNEIDGIHSPSTVYEEQGKHDMEGLAQGIRNNAYLAIDALREVLNSLASLAETGLNNIVTKFNGVASGLTGAEGANVNINRLPPVYIPRLAQGAVIPPNREFLAVLGDQQRGTNVEAPLETIVQAVRQALGGNRQTIVLELDRRELGRAVADVSKLESQRVGIKIGGSYA